nr:MAG TPA: hypothetical protein [Caudoviricetes sp.]
MPRGNGTPHPDFHTNRLTEKNIKKEKLQDRDRSLPCGFSLPTNLKLLI